MNDVDDCNCFLCKFRRSLDEPLPAEQAQEPVSIPDNFQAAQENLMLAQTIDLMTISMERAYNCNEVNVAAGIRRALDLVLPAPVESVRPTPGTANEGQGEPADTAPAAARSANAPLTDDLMDQLPPALRSLFSALTAFGADVQVMRFPKQ